MTLNVVKFPDHHAALDVPESLRMLADDIEAGEHGASHSLLWIIDCGDGDISLGLMGKAGEPGTTAYYLAGLAQRKLEQGIG